MAIFKYKKPNGSGGYSIEEMPVISNTYTEYVVKDATDGTKTITLTPLHTSESTGAGAFEDVVASVKLLSTDPTYAPSTSQQTITYDRNGFPKKITISAIPTTTKTYTSSATKQEYNFTTSTGFPTKVTINAIPSNGNKTITLSPGTLSSSLDPGYYGTISTSVKTYSTNPSYTPSTSAQNITYTATTGFPKGITISAIPTTTLTLENNNTTYNIGSGSWSAGTYPTSITVQVPSDLPAASSPPSTTTITTQNGSIKINAGYYTSDITITATFPSVSPSSNQSLTPNKTSYSIPIGYHASSKTVSVSTGTLTITDPSLTLSGSTASITISPTASGTWVNTYYPNKVAINFTNKSPSSNQSLTPSKSSFTIPTGYHATSNRTVSVSSGSKSITSNGTYYASTDGYYYSSVTVDVQGITLANIEDSKEATESMILNGYKAYNDKGTLITGSLTSNSVGIRQIIYPSDFTLSNSMYQYRIFGDTPEYIKDFTIAMNADYQEITSNGTYYLFGSSASWSSFPSSLYVNVSSNSMTNSGALGISANGTYSTANSSSYYSSVVVNVPGIVIQGTCSGDGAAYKLMSDGTLFFYSTENYYATISAVPTALNAYASTVTKVIFSNIESIDCSSGNSFSSFSNITSITFNEGLSKINQTQFKSLTLRYLYFPNSLSWLGSTCFWSCNITYCFFCGWTNFYSPFGSSYALNSCTVTSLTLPWPSSWSGNANIHPPFGATVSSTGYKNSQIYLS